MQSALFDGIGNFSCSSSDPRCVPAEQRKPLFSKVFEAGKRYLFRLINSSTESDSVFSIDNHQLQVISNDLVAIQPFTTDAIHIGIGQRYSVIVEANPSTPKQPDGNYWIRTQVSINCGNIDDGNYDSRTGIIRYDPQSTTPPTSTNQTEIDLTCEDLPTKSLVPVLPWQVDHQAVNDVLKDTFIADLNTVPTHGYLRWDLTDNPLWLNFSNPTILNLGDPSALPAEYAIVPKNYTNGYVYLVITSQQLANFPIKRIVPAAHPIHLHGHDFVILAQSSANYSVTDSPRTFNFDNPPRRDVALLPVGGYLTIAFKPDNPGVWLVHCHIAWHASSGLALQILERQDDIISTLPNGALDATESTCKGWDDWLALPENDGTFAGDLQDDSGI